MIPKSVYLIILNSNVLIALSQLATKHYWSPKIAIGLLQHELVPIFIL